MISVKTTITNIIIFLYHFNICANKYHPSYWFRHIEFVHPIVSETDDITSMMPNVPEIQQLFDEMVKQKHEEFADFKNIIADFEIKKIRGLDYDLAVATAPLRDLLGPIPYFYESINRNAIVVKPKKPLLDWINFIYPDSLFLKKRKKIFISLRKWTATKQ